MTQPPQNESPEERPHVSFEEALEEVLREEADTIAALAKE